MLQKQKNDIQQRTRLQQQPEAFIKSLMLLTSYYQTFKATHSNFSWSAESAAGTLYLASSHPIKMITEQKNLYATNLSLKQSRTITIFDTTVPRVLGAFSNCTSMKTFVFKQLLLEGDDELTKVNTFTHQKMTFPIQKFPLQYFLQKLQHCLFSIPDLF